jgi:hypothetical protein
MVERRPRPAQQLSGLRPILWHREGGGFAWNMGLKAKTRLFDATTATSLAFGDAEPMIALA